MKHDKQCEAGRSPYECHCAERAYWATASHEEKIAFMDACPDLHAILKYSEVKRYKK